MYIAAHEPKPTGIKEGLKNIKNNVKNGVKLFTDKIKNITKKSEESEEEKADHSESFEILPVSNKRHNTVMVTNSKIVVDQDDCLHTQLSQSIMRELRPSIEEKAIISDDYFGTSGVRRPKRSTSESRFIEDEYEEVTDVNYILTEHEWREILDSKTKLTAIAEQRLICSIKFGLPGRLRGKIWEFLVKVNKYKSKTPEMYSNYLAKPNNDSTDYTISKDILRTFPEDKMHKEDYKSGNNKLFNVLKAYSTYDTDVKYCQGMNFIVFLFLKNLDDNEERAFWLLVAMMNKLKWRKLYKLDTPKLMKLLERLRKKMKKEVPEVYQHLMDQDLPIEGIFAPYFLTLFLYSTPINIAERIIDCFLYKGEDFLLEMTIRMLKMKRAKILKFDSEQGCSFELQMYLSKQMVEECCADTTIKSILSQSQLSESKNVFNF